MDYIEEKKQREIKFRELLPNGKFHYWGFLRDGAFIGPSDPKGNHMQFTGLKDKTGKEVYEGDILRWPPSEDWEINNYSCFEVFFHDGDSADGHIGFQMNRMHCHGAINGGIIYQFRPKTVLKLQVIGNIYENPELLK